MEAKVIRKAHCLFEQSGTFKNEFIKLGIPAEDYDIQNHFNQTDHVIDLFGEIEKAYANGTDKGRNRAAGEKNAVSLFHMLLYKLMFIAEHDNLKLVIENPATKPSYLIGTQNFPNPTFIDKNRMERGDWFVKPTAYWFINFEPTHGFTRQNDKEQKIINKCKQGIKAGICSEERSLISPDYARNFICDFIIGKKQENQREPELF